MTDTTARATASLDEFREQARDLDRRQPRARRDAATAPRRRGGADDDGRGHRRGARARSASCSTPGTPGSRTRPSTAAGGSPPPTSGRSARRPPATSRPTSASPAASRSAPIGRSMLAHASPEFLAPAHPARSSRGEEIWCQFYSEPEAGSDLAGIRTRADARRRPLDPQRVEDLELAARTTPTGRCAWPAPTGTCPKHRGLTWFAVPTDAAGVTVSQITPDQRQRRVLRGVPRRRRSSPTTTSSARSTDGWAVTQTMLVYERGGRAPPRRRWARRERRAAAPTSST